MVAREPITIILAGPPIGKGRPRFARATGHAYTPEKTRSFEGALKYAGQEVMRGAAPLDGPITMLVIAIFPIPASWSAKKRAAAIACEIWPTVKPDFDNLGKCAGDALNEICFRDDKQIVDGRVIKRYGERPRLVIEIREVSSYSADCGASSSASPARARDLPRDSGRDLFKTEKPAAGLLGAPSAAVGASASEGALAPQPVKFHAPTLKDRSSGDVVLSQTMDPSAEAPNVDRSSRPLLASSGGTDWP